MVLPETCPLTLYICIYDYRRHHLKRLFYIGCFLLVLFEILNVYFIMPMPGSQRYNTLNTAYFLYQYRWSFRVVFGLLILLGSFRAFSTRQKWIPLISLVAALAVTFMVNFKMQADKAFLQPETLSFKTELESQLGDSTVVLVVANDDDAKAYPIRYIAYHHQIRDTLAGKQIMVTYCNVCRSGRVFDPIVNGKVEIFRLVGMDHFNAMIEDNTTKSWWRQANGEAVTGALKGHMLEEIESDQMTLGKFFSLYPHGLVMQPDDQFIGHYDTLGRFEWGRNKGKLTGTDSLSWENKSWVLGLLDGDSAKAYDWNALKEKRIIHDQFNGKPVLILLSDDDQSFAAFFRNSEADTFLLRNDTLHIGANRYDFLGKNIDNESESLDKVRAYQEFWHSWQTFHPQTKTYK